MGQAKQRKAEIDQLKAQGPRARFASGTKRRGQDHLDRTKFRPDAGLNLPRDQDGFIWFQVGELFSSLNHCQHMRGYEYQGRRYMELNIIADIMDEQGRQHLVPQQTDGYLATIAFTADNLRELADQIAKGAMSVRIRGRRSGHTETAINTGEQFEPIWFREAWSAGNNAGFMTYMVLVDGVFRESDSQRLADFFRGLADDLAQGTNMRVVA